MGTATSPSPTCTPTWTGSCVRPASRYPNGGWTAMVTCPWPSASRRCPPRPARQHHRLGTWPRSRSPASQKGSPPSVRGPPRPQSAAAVVITGGVIATLVLALGGSGARPQAGGSPDTSTRTFTATAPWRLKIDASGYGNGCSLTYIDTHSGNQKHLADSLYGVSTFQISDTGTFRWQVDDPQCVVVPLRGTGTAHLPFTINQFDTGDSDVFTAPASVVVHVKDWYGNSSCKFGLFD